MINLDDDIILANNMRKRAYTKTIRPSYRIKP